MRIVRGPQLGDEQLRLLRRDREEKATGGLWIEEEGSQVGFNWCCFFDDAIGEVAVGEEAPRDTAEADRVHRAIKQGNGRGVNAEAYVAAEGQLASVAHKAEASDVSSGMHLELPAANDCAADLVEGGHRRDGGFDPRLLRFALLGGRGDDAGAAGLGG